MGWKGKRDRRIPRIPGSKNNAAQSLHTFAGGSEGGLSDEEHGTETGNRIRSRLCKKKKQKTKKEIAPISLWGQIFLSRRL